MLVSSAIVAVRIDLVVITFLNSFGSYYCAWGQ